MGAHSRRPFSIPVIFHEPLSSSTTWLIDTPLSNSQPHDKQKNPPNKSTHSLTHSQPIQYLLLRTINQSLTPSSTILYYTILSPQVKSYVTHSLTRQTNTLQISFFVLFMFFFWLVGITPPLRFHPLPFPSLPSLSESVPPPPPKRYIRYLTLLTLHTTD